MKKQQILLDMDGVLSDFLQGALDVLNRTYDTNRTVHDYCSYGKFSINEFYGITADSFWKIIDNTPSFWARLKPFPWAKNLYEDLCSVGEVTIVTSPSLKPNCASQKLYWLDRVLGVKSNAVFIGSRKYLMAGNGVLIDDYNKNVLSFREAGGNAILVPSNWNTHNLTYDHVWDAISTNLQVIYDVNLYH